MEKRRTLIVAAAVAVLVLIVALVTGYCGRHVESERGTPAPTVATPKSGLPTVPVAELPKQAHDTLALIDKGGPFKYKQDGGVFSNAERLLPQKERGYYREYTVETPRSRDRGARRIVAGRDGDLYYTSDHYDSFRQIIR